MKLDYHNIRDEGIFIVTSFQCGPSLHLLTEKDLYKIVWCVSGEQELTVDGYDVILKANQVLFCTPDNIVNIPKDNYGLISYIFNREFYCIQNQDAEVSCLGLLFYGSSNAPVVDLLLREQNSMSAMLVLFQEEFENKDHIQGEMLRAMLKRMLITATRLIKTDRHQENLSTKQVDLIRKFNILVEQHFKEKHQVADYADLLFKSPKTLSNFFRKHDVKSPLKVINERIALEAKRLLRNSEMTAEEIAYDLGYGEPSHFSKFFKKQTGRTPLEYRKNEF
ncbi:helix-turn-helix domain-containing protein [Nonlabens antarcticus]|uniref:helix-turn-helix domain-containing protein n=1 Tax=Nonlabens antarcticus TaxID=392714 RepID=UPI00189125C0|nr:AraC family transcriptional regulator [Nonlabens antarcticus]